MEIFYSSQHFVTNVPFWTDNIHGRFQFLDLSPEGPKGNNLQVMAGWDSVLKTFFMYVDNTEPLLCVGSYPGECPTIEELEEKFCGQLKERVTDEYEFIKLPDNVVRTLEAMKAGVWVDEGCLTC